jgi:hypothetical protein
MDVRGPLSKERPVTYFNSRRSTCSLHAEGPVEEKIALSLLRAT